MHRAYQPCTPTNNTFLKRKWDEKLFQRHREKVEGAKHVVDTSPPKVYNHLVCKLKKMHEEDILNAALRHYNLMLQNKMDYIMRNGGYTDHRNNYTSKSLNGPRRQRELARVNKENVRMMKRIEERKPNYTCKQQLTDWKKSRNYLINVSKYPPPTFALWPISKPKCHKGDGVTNVIKQCPEINIVESETPVEEEDGEEESRNDDDTNNSSAKRNLVYCYPLTTRRTCTLPPI